MKRSHSFEISIAVVPFVNASEDAFLNYFVEGFYEDFLMDLARFKTLQIISPNSLNKLDDPLSAAHSVGADFAITGKVRKSGNQLTLYIQLHDASNNHLIWGERFHSELDQLPDLQIQIIQQLVNTIQEQIERELLVVARLKKVENMEAYDFWLKGYNELKKGTLESDLEARKFFNMALEKDPYCSRAYTGLSLSHFNEWSCQLWSLWGSSMQNALHYATKAIELDPNDAVSLTVIGRVYLYKGDYERGAYYLKKSLELSPNEANNLAQIAVSYVYLGKYQKALKLYKKAIRLNPLNEASYYASGTLIYAELGNFNKAIELGLKANLERSWVDLSGMIAGCYYMTGRLEKMEAHWQVFLDLFEERLCHDHDMQKGEALDWMIRISPYKKKSQFIPFWEYMSSKYISEADPETAEITPDKHENLFTKGTGVWQMTYQQKTVFLPDKKGYYDLAQLLDAQNEKISALELIGSRLLTEHKARTLDQKALDAYKKRLLSLQEDIALFDERNDYENLRKSQEEYDELLQFVSRSMNVKGQPKKFTDNADKARSAVTWRIRHAIKTIKEVHPDLSDHLSSFISTGHYCSYQPSVPIEWQT